MYLSIVMSRKKSKLGHRANNTDGSDTQCEPRNKKRGRRVWENITATRDALQNGGDAASGTY